MSLQIFLVTWDFLTWYRYHYYDSVYLTGYIWMFTKTFEIPVLQAVWVELKNGFVFPVKGSFLQLDIQLRHSSNTFILEAWIYVHMSVMTWWLHCEIWIKCSWPYFFSKIPSAVTARKEAGFERGLTSEPNAGLLQDFPWFSRGSCMQSFL